MNSYYLKERLEFAKRLKEAPSCPKPNECDMVPPLELLGIYIAHSAVTRMVYDGTLDKNVGTYINATLATHSYAILHGCVHESISQHNEDYKPFEASVYRLASMMLFFDDGHVQVHKQHHRYTNSPTKDPDHIAAAAPLKIIGGLFAGLDPFRPEWRKFIIYKEDYELRRSLVT